LCNCVPCAYFENEQCVSPLTRHSWAVLLVARQAVAPRLLGPSRELDMIACKGSLKRALDIAAVYHDLGKAANRFQQNRRSFRLHEHVSAVILWETAEMAMDQDEEGLAVILKVAAGAVARHHAAMQGRHPAEIVMQGEKNTFSEISSLVQDVPLNTPDLLANGRIPGLIHRALEKLQNDGTHGNLYYVVRKRMDEILEMRHYNHDLLTDTIIVAGTLIVADILVSSMERSNKVTKSYAKSWMRELEISEKKLGDLINNARKPCLD